MQTTQREAYGDVIRIIQNGQSLSNGPPLLTLSPFIDQNGVLCVGGKLDKSKTLSQGDINLHPIIMTKNHYATRLLVRRFYHQVFHHGRLLTEGALRSGGYWVVGDKTLIRSDIKSCVTCRKLRGSLGWQLMVVLSKDRLKLCWSRQRARYTSRGC